MTALQFLMRSPAKSSSFSTRWFLILLLSYFAIHFIIRLSISTTLNHDESEQVMFTQELRWGYGSQPPLFTWLAWGTFQIFGMSIATLTMLRWVVLGTTYLFVYLSGRIVLGDSARAAIASFSLLMIPSFTWQFIRDQSHTPLACALSAATFYVLLRALPRRSCANYLWLGFVVGLGLLSKYNFVFVVVSFVLASCTFSQGRRLLFNWRILISIALAGVMVLPHFFWMLDHLEPIREFLGRKMGSAVELSPGVKFLQAMTSLGGNLVLMLGCMVTFYFWVFPKSLLSRPADQDNYSLPRTLLYRALLCMLGVLLALPLITKQKQFATHWLAPFFYLMTLAICSRIPKPDLKSRRFQITIATLLLTVLGYSIAHACMITKYRGRDELYHQQAKQIGDRIQSADIVLIDEDVTGANLRLLYPNARYVNFHYDEFEKLSLAGKRVLVIWDASLYPDPHWMYHYFQERSVRFPRAEEWQRIAVAKERGWVVNVLGFVDVSPSTDVVFVNSPR